MQLRALQTPSSSKMFGQEGKLLLGKVTFRSFWETRMGSRMAGSDRAKRHEIPSMPTSDPNHASAFEIANSCTRQIRKLSYALKARTRSPCGCKWSANFRGGK
ncbi:hypothetical protein MLIT_10360 [Mycolicibacterium litorale]|uniref:Uncharacterized protein n=1 Tax=Mycolicibacterium litorale TaxID=758802 RepID=A0AAD1IHA3_9MYCO|nr:hypothetical protein MLIT_10360 [Mycolicibacterium litorale]